MRRLTDYQDPAYARLYLERLVPVLAVDRHGAGSDYRLTNETARHLALWMSYEDVIRVADLKTRPERFARVREETGAKAREPVVVVEFLKPGDRGAVRGAAGRPRPARARLRAEARAGRPLQCRPACQDDDCRPASCCCGRWRG